VSVLPIPAWHLWKRSSEWDTLQFVEPSSRPHVECGQTLLTRLLDKRTREVGLAAAGRIVPGINRLAQE
jgi:hypothetical protein